MRRVFLDTEWTAVPWSSDAELLWIGLASEDGSSWYGISASPDVRPGNEKYVSDLRALLSPDDPRFSQAELAAHTREFCGEVDEFWVWIPTLESFAAWSRLGEEAPAAYESCKDIDLKMLRALVSPWPSTWPTHLRDLNAAAGSVGIPIPPRQPNHLHPRVHAQWNRELFRLIRTAGYEGDA